ncbi:MAG TPA: hypothetical protein VG406_07815 [Isosphaeraceae bacterium]|nr:hypothetical protein [Isosphaeraceae bacterium]
MERRRRPALRPVVVSLEGRELLSGIIATLHGRLHHAPLARIAAAAQQPASGTSSVSAAASSSASGSGFEAITGTPISVTYQGQQPTPFQVKREQFRAVFSGPYQTGLPLFLDQSSRTVIDGIGTSTYFLHGSLQLIVVTYKDAPPPNLTYGTNQPLQGMATLIDKNQNSSGYLAVDLQGDRTGLDSAGRPTQVTFNFFPFGGSGSFTAGIFSLASGSGTVSIQYHPSGTTRPGLTSQGTATVVFRGTIFTPQTVFPLANSGLQASHHKV